MRFTPAANFDHSTGFSDFLKKEVEGTVIEIHEDHRWYRVEFNMGSAPGCIGHECFKY